MLRQKVSSAFCKQLQKSVKPEVEVESFSKGVSRFLKKDAGSRTVTHQEEGKKYVKDYTQKQTKLEFEADAMDDSSGVMKVGERQVAYKKNTENSLDVSDNALALQILSEKSIDLKDERIAIRRLSSTQLMGDIKSIDLGEVNVTKQNAMHIDDVDVFDIPEDKDIELDKNVKRMYAYGVQSDREKSHGQSVVGISNRIVEEQSLQEFKDKYLFKFEQHLLVTTKLDVLKRLIRNSPFYIVILCFVDSFLDLYLAKQEKYIIDKQQLDPMHKYLHQKQNQLLLDDINK